MQRGSISGSDAHLPAAHAGINNSSCFLNFTMGTTAQLTVSISNSPVVVTIFCTKTPARCR